MKMDTFQFFGMEDSVHNHIILNRKEDHGYASNINEKGLNLLNKRAFQVCCIKDSECLFLDMVSIDKMKRDFMSVAIKFFKKMLDQYVIILAYKKHCSQSFKETWYSPEKKSNFSKSITDRKNITNFMKKQAFMLQECSNQINQMYEQQPICQSMDLDWTLSESSVDIDIQSPIKEANEEDEESSREHNIFDSPISSFDDAEQ